MRHGTVVEGLVAATEVRERAREGEKDESTMCSKHSFVDREEISNVFGRSCTVFFTQREDTTHMGGG